ncbi:hypothetical protein DV113_001599 [Geotrichum candidum]|nr:hypothetical protein DV113_001599 [Geotrichum candidum]KAI8131318.1 hypothetical protein DUD61_005021 [Geotrichum candidum]KAI9210131.1 hypothetical protein DS838_004991 [Geotrichum bryndzae]
MIDSPSFQQQNPPGINTKLDDQKRQFSDTFKDNLSPAKKRNSKSAANPPPRKRTTRASSQTYIESAKEKKAAAAAAAAAAAKGEFIPTEIKTSEDARVFASNGSVSDTSADSNNNNNENNKSTSRLQSPQVSQMNTNFSQFSLNALSRFQSKPDQQQQPDSYRSDDAFYIPGEQPTSNPQSNASFLPTPSSDVTPETAASNNPIFHSSSYENPSPVTTQSEPGKAKHEATAAAVEHYSAPIEGPNIFFEQEISPGANWLFNLSSTHSFSASDQQQGQSHISIPAHDPAASMEKPAIINRPEPVKQNNPPTNTNKYMNAQSYAAQQHHPSKQPSPHHHAQNSISDSQPRSSQQQPTYLDDNDALEKLGILMQTQNGYANPRYPLPTNPTQRQQFFDHRTRITPPPAAALKAYKFPILQSVEHLIAPFPMALAQDLLESYFSNSTHVLAYLVRKNSILSPTNPRQTSPALLFSFLLVAAHHSDNPILTGSMVTRKNIIDRLTDLTMSNLTTVHNITPEVTLDDVITYIQLGTVVSASEFKGYSLRFWAAAWALGKELKLNIENPELPEETREEQRRTWWLLYMVDRHLGLCYNQPLAILDSESTSLYRPVEDSVWNSDAVLTPAELDVNRLKGLCHFVTGQGLFGYFLPLMTILGSLIELHHFQQNPVVNMTDVNRTMKPHIRGYLEQYTNSLKNWTSVPCNNINENSWRDYAFQLSHVLYILALVPWDPTELLDSPDSLMLSPEFNEALSHAISASKHTRRILTIDADLMLMPFFFGIYLLQSSFVLLFIVDRVESEASHDVFAACETIVHAHEVCVVTLNTEYQRNFRRVMRGTINLLNSDNAAKNTPSSTGSGSPMGGMQDPKLFEERLKKEKEEARKRRRDVLGLYRWSPGGHGLAV